MLRHAPVFQMLIPRISRFSLFCSPKEIPFYAVTLTRLCQFAHTPDWEKNNVYMVEQPYLKKQAAISHTDVAAAGAGIGAAHGIGEV